MIMCYYHWQIAIITKNGSLASYSQQLQTPTIFMRVLTILITISIGSQAQLCKRVLSSNDFSRGCELGIHGTPSNDGKYFLFVMTDEMIKLQRRKYLFSTYGQWPHLLDGSGARVLCSLRVNCEIIRSAYTPRRGCDMNKNSHKFSKYVSFLWLCVFVPLDVGSSLHLFFDSEIKGNHRTVDTVNLA